MPYFGSFPTIQYEEHVVKNLTLRVKIKRIVGEALDSYEPYRVLDGETPEQLAHDFYGDSNLHWIILLFNEIIDPLYDWVLTTSDLFRLVTANYGAGNEYAVHHWEVDGQWVDAGTDFAVAVSNFEYEDKINESKREIKIVNPIFISQIVREFERLIKV